MKKIKTIPMFILLFTGYLCNGQDEATATTHYTEEDYMTIRLQPTTYEDYTDSPSGLSPPLVGGKHIQNSSRSSAPDAQGHGPGRGLPTLVVAGVSIALVLLFILIVAVFWYAQKKSQEGSIQINPIPYGEAGVSFRTVPVPEN